MLSCRDIEKRQFQALKRRIRILWGLKVIYFTNNQLPEIIIQTEQHTKCFLCSDEISVTQNVHGTIRVI